jgi:hypothetical protein
MAKLAPPPAPSSPPPAPAPAPAPARPDDDDLPSGPPAHSSRRVRMPSLGAGGGAVDNGAGIILAFLAWVWVLDPFLQHGPTGVKDVLRAKFFNKDKDGNWLP